MLKLKCKKHPKYSGQVAPRASCSPCQYIFNARVLAYQNHVIVVVPQPKREGEAKEAVHD
jgi:hypothetical protein